MPQSFVQVVQQLRTDSDRSAIDAVVCFEGWSGAFCVAAGHRSGGVKVWDGEAARLLVSLAGHNDEMWAMVAFKEQQGGRDRIATTSYDGLIKVWECSETGGLLHTLTAHRYGGERLRAYESSTGACRLVSSGEADNTGVRIWDPQAGVLLHELRGNTDTTRNLTIFGSSDEEHARVLLASVTVDGVLRVWDLGEAPARAPTVRAANKLG
jgi:WD40 repeat protein